MKVAEMKSHYDKYTAIEARIRPDVENRVFPGVFATCRESFPHTLGMLKHRKKAAIEPETPQLLAFVTICRYAPPLFEHAVIMSLFEFT